MNQENNILDDFLRQQVEGTEFSFKEDYWSKMSEKLDNEDKRKKGFWLWRGLSMLAVLIVVGGGTFLYSKVFHKKSNQSEVVKQELKAEPISEATSPNETEPIDETNSSETVNSSLTNEPSNQNQNSTNQNIPTTNSTSNTNNSSTTNQNSQQNNTQQLTTQPSNSKSQTDPTNQDAVVKKTANKRIASGIKVDEIIDRVEPAKKERKDKKTKAIQSRKNEVVQNNSSSKASNTNREIVKKNVKTKSKNSKNKDLEKIDMNLNRNAKSSNATQNSNNDALDSKNHKDNTVANNPLVINGQSMRAVDSVTYYPKQQLDPSKTNPRYIASLSDYIPEYIDHIKIYDLEPVKGEEVASASSAQAKASKPVYDLKPLNYYFLAGLNANMGMKGTLDKKMPVGFSPYVGVGLEKEIAPKITLASHVGFTYFNALNSNKVVTNTVYSFGVDSSNFSVEHKKMMQMYLPLTMNYEILKRHYLMLSIGASYTFDVSSSVKENSNSNPKSTFGYKTGFNVFDFFMQGGYQFQLSNKFGFMIWYQRGFTDMTKNAYFNNTNKDIQSRVSIGLKYSFGRNSND